MSSSNNNDELEEVIRQGQAAYRDGAYTQEVHLWKRASVLDPENPYWQANLAHAFFNAGNPDQAAILFEHVMAMAPHVSQAYNNYSQVLIAQGVPLSDLFLYFVLAVETSENYERFQRHILNVCASVALADTTPHAMQWDGVAERSLAFLQRVGDRTPESEAFVTWAVSTYRGYETFMQLLSVQDWQGSDKKLDDLQVAFSNEPLCEVESNRIARFRPQVKGAVALFDLFAALGSQDDLKPHEFHERCSSILDFYKETQRYMVGGSGTFLNLLGWCAAELRRQISWFNHPSQPFEARSNSIPNDLFTAYSATRYAEIAELFQTVTLQVNRILRRASEKHAVERGGRREIVLSKAWLSIKVAIHGAVDEFSGLTNVIGREMLGWNKSPYDRVRADISRFKSFVESQGYNDMYIKGNPQEGIGRAILQAFLMDNGFSEVPVRGGRVDILVVQREASFVVETKIWRGAQYHDDGITELMEYIANNSIPNFAGGFYVVFDPTESSRAQSHVMAAPVRCPGIETVVVNINPTPPSKKGAAKRKDLL